MDQFVCVVLFVLWWVCDFGFEVVIGDFMWLLVLQVFVVLVEELQCIFELVVLVGECCLCEVQLILVWIQVWLDMSWQVGMCNSCDMCDILLVVGVSLLLGSVCCVELDICVVEVELVLSSIECEVCEFQFYVILVEVYGCYLIVWLEVMCMVSDVLLCFMCVENVVEKVWCVGVISYMEWV